MKINWGTGIVLAMAGFIVFILYFVITMVTDNKFNFELVVEDYYKKEIGFQQQLDAQKNASILEERVKIEQSNKGLMIVFPDKKMASDLNNGTVSFYRVSQKNLDFEIPLVLENDTMFIPATKLLPGRWDVSIEWNFSGKPYMVTEKIMF